MDGRVYGRPSHWCLYRGPLGCSPGFTRLNMMGSMGWLPETPAKSSVGPNPWSTLIIIHKATEGVSGTMLARFLNRGRRELKLGGEVTLLLTSSAQLKRLNREFRGKDYATDVLSFPPETQPRRPRKRPAGARAEYAGDIAISVDIARQNGRAIGHGTAVEIKTLILHGLLHLGGYDHERDNGRMARRELRLRRALRLPEGLIERAGSGSSRAKPKTRRRSNER